ncbi:MAG: Asp-tRNA(Asn)/Glu-tRNA(Gln) amidotransferase subunit GatB [Deltaproteobacteria bacterium]|nr:Asp-tRNA(Asn)/Glu-tRNA(Gln) amidotransferase subunit GatB [Deltaproteobacteria bacterium]
MSAHPDYEVVIGLEVHVQLRTRSKLFSTAGVSYGDEPNQHTTPVCLALPGALPVLNAHAVELAIRAGAATNCTIHPTSIFARKNYFYPDLPKGYQISQFEHPLCTDGWLEIETDGLKSDGSKTGGTKRIQLTRIHMEEDAGKSLHDGRADQSRIDLNRAGVPLVEIVSEPDLRSAEEAGFYLRKLHAILRTVGVSDADMEKGQFRCDANVSLRKHGATELGTRREIKNVNSFRFVEAAIEAEIVYQADLLDSGGEVRQATVGYDAENDRLFLMRLKENADDYRYFPDPDLIPLVISQERIDAIRAALPELPDVRRHRFEEAHGLAAADAAKLVGAGSLADFFEAAVAAGAEPKAAAKWLTRDVVAWLNEQERESGDSALETQGFALAPAGFASLLGLVDAGRLTAKSARDLLPDLLAQGGDPESLMQERGLEAVSDSGALEAMADDVLAAQPKAIESFREGDQKAVNFLMGQVMKQSQGKADPAQVRKILIAKLEAL